MLKIFRNLNTRVWWSNPKSRQKKKKTVNRHNSSNKLRNETSLWLESSRSIEADHKLFVKSFDHTHCTLSMLRALVIKSYTRANTKKKKHKIQNSTHSCWFANDGMYNSNIENWYDIFKWYLHKQFACPSTTLSSLSVSQYIWCAHNI